MKIKNQKDFWAGIMFLIFGAFFAILGVQYKIGTAAKMGPGYFPTFLGMIVISLGVVISLSSLSATETDHKAAKFGWPSLFFILGSVVLFGLTLRPLGLILSLFILIATSSYASKKFSWKSMLVNSAVLILMCLGIFVWSLQLQIPLSPSFMTN
jgi:hypothetical protein